MNTMAIEDEQRRKNVRLALILASIAAVFFAGIIVKFVVFAH